MTDPFKQAIRPILSVAIALFTLAGCGSQNTDPENDNNTPPPVASDSTSAMESPDILQTEFVGPVGDVNKDGLNIGTKFTVGSTSEKPSSLKLFVIERQSGNVTSTELASLSKYSVEIEILKNDSIRIFRLNGIQHFSNKETFAIESPTDFKISLNYPENQGYWIVGEEDSRPAIHEAFSSTDINFNSASPKQVRLSYKSTSNSSGIVTISGNNTTVGKTRTPCSTVKTGVPAGGWGIRYGKDCPGDN